MNALLHYIGSLDENYLFVRVRRQTRFFTFDLLIANQLINVILTLAIPDIC